MDSSDNPSGASETALEPSSRRDASGVEKEKTDAKETVVKGKKTVNKRKPRKAVKKKPDDMPRRPLSAYNYFFSEVRAKLVSEKAEGKDSGFQAFLEELGAGVEGNKKNGLFSNMGKFVAKHWKALSQDEMKPYTDKADADLERYRREMDDYREGVAKKTRLASEAKLREHENKEEPAANPESSRRPSLTARLGSGETNLGNPGAAQSFAAPGQQLMQSSPSQQFSGPAAGQPHMMQPGLDPTYQFLLHQQLLSSQNPQLNALLFQQQQMGMHGFQQLNGYGQMMFPQTGIPGAQEWFSQQQQQQQQQPGRSSETPGSPPSVGMGAYPQLSGQPFPGYAVQGGIGMGQQALGMGDPHASQHDNFMMMMGQSHPGQQQLLGFPQVKKKIGQHQQHPPLARGGAERSG